MGILSWRALSFLFAGVAGEGEQPASFILRRGRAIGQIDVGYRLAGVLPFSPWPFRLESGRSGHGPRCRVEDVDRTRLSKEDKRS
jgi:hypothetical protein